jgi:hypothetical protein
MLFIQRTNTVDAHPAALTRKGIFSGRLCVHPSQIKSVAKAATAPIGRILRQKCWSPVTRVGIAGFYFLSDFERHHAASKCAIVPWLSMPTGLRAGNSALRSA